MEKAYLIVAIAVFLNCLSSCLANDRDALLAFKAYITDDPLKMLANNWTSSPNTSVCTSIGVTCDLNNQRETELNLHGIRLGGTIAPHLGNLTFLTKIDLRDNNFYGFLPEELGRLQNLQNLILLNNSISGTIPTSLSNSSKLATLTLGINALEGEIPASLWNCKELKFLSLAVNKLSGSLPREIGNLTMLTHLIIAKNNFNGMVPVEISNLKQLKELVISSSSLTGPIPSNIFNISSLEIIDFKNNSLSGSLPLEIQFNAPALKSLHLSYNNFTGSISNNIGNLTMLKVLDFDANNLTGALPFEINNLNLEELYVGINSLTGTPSEVFNISTLKILGLHFNKFSGHLPSSMGLCLPNLEELYLNHNRFSGKIPASISNASRLSVLLMNVNSFTGSVPNTLGNLRFLQRLFLAGNNLTRESSTTELRFISSLTSCRELELLTFSKNQLNGVLPAAVGNLSTSLRLLDAYQSKIKGDIPIGIGNLSSLETILLDHNELTRTIPSTLGRLKNLGRMHLGVNRLQGSIPNELCDLKRMGDLSLSNNRLGGSIPACFGELRSLMWLSLDSNRLTSTIPSTLWAREDLISLNLSSNFLSGFLPSDIGNLKVITLMDFSWNQLSGNIPDTIGGALTLCSFSLSHNKLQGSIPKSLGSLIGLEFLDLSNNILSGMIPKSLEELRYLQYFNVSFNELEGEIPTGGQFWSFTAMSFMGNRALCGSPRLQVKLCKDRTSDESGSNILTLLKYILLPIPAGILSGSLIFMILRRLRRYEKHKSPSEWTRESYFLSGGGGPVLAQVDSLPISWRSLSYDELFEATNSFNESNLLGVGSIGSVYKGTLSDGLVVAVKVFNLQSEGALKIFDAEFQVMCNIRHRNLTKLISRCIELEFKALVLDYMLNGSLEKCLYSESYILDILQRLNIMIDIASALAYLHNGHLTPIVHCDLKPSNVLLDEDMGAHVSDFGVAKLLGKEALMRQTKTLATVGYMAPEYGMEGIVSTSCDVYSYGVLLMETFTRKKPTDEMFYGEMSLRGWVEEALNGSVIKVLDTNLVGRDEEHLSDAKERCLVSIFSLAMECSKRLPKERIGMEDIVVRLNKIKTMYVESIDAIPEVNIRIED